MVALLGATTYSYSLSCLVFRSVEYLVSCTTEYCKIVLDNILEVNYKYQGDGYVLYSPSLHCTIAWKIYRNTDGRTWRMGPKVRSERFQGSGLGPQDPMIVKKLKRVPPALDFDSTVLRWIVSVNLKVGIGCFF